VTSLLGSGGMGEVYRARDTRLAREVAIKVLPESLSGDPDRLNRLEHEARSLASLSHPHIATVFGLEEHNGTLCLIMEYVPGVSLAERLAGEPLPWRDALDILRQVAHALEAAHAKGVIHRDLKPSNVMVTPDGRVKLLDFGLAKTAGGNDSDPAALTQAPPMTVDGVIMGTVAYMSPEQARGQALDTRTDVWSFGCLLYEVLSGRRAFPADTLSDTIVAVLEREPDWESIPPTTPAAVAALLRRCLHKDKSRRLHHIADARLELEAALATAGDVTAGTAIRGWWPASRLRTALALLALLAAAGLAVTLSLRSRAGYSGAAGTATLAVLPFHVTAGLPSDADLGLGLADDIITHLANIGQLRVRPTQAVLGYQGRTPDVQEAGRALRADTILTGIIRRQPAGFRVTVQLTRVEDGVPHWGESYDLGKDELPGLEDRITEQVAAALGLRVSREAMQRNSQRFTKNASAYESYLQGRASMVVGSESGTRTAVDAFERALRLDAGYALAHAGLAMAAAQMHLRFAPAQEAPAWRERAIHEAERAQTLDADLAETHQALADVYGKTEFEWDRVITESDRALQLNPGLELPPLMIARAFYHLGLLERAGEKVRSVLARDPENRSDALRTQGIAALLSGRFKQAVLPLEEVQHLSGKPLSDINLALAYYYSGDTRRGEAVLEEMSGAPSAGSSQRARAWLAAFLAARGEGSRASSIVGQVTAGGYMDHHVAAGLGSAYAQLGRPEEALRWLRNAADHGFPCPPWYARDPLLAPLRQHPAFEAWLRELQSRLRQDEQRYLRY
jgi:TolB-like protein/tetratricopeptide (TPR) repeat protein